MEQQKLNDALDRAVQYIINSSDDYCPICPRRKQCDAESLAQGDDWEPSQVLCRAMLKEYFMKG